MTEFKGTRGNWEIIEDLSKGTDNHSFIVYSEEIEEEICEVKIEANAKLIACALEMLEMLERLYDGSAILKEEIEQLIKKATE